MPPLLALPFAPLASVAVEGWSASMLAAMLTSPFGVDLYVMLFLKGGLLAGALLLGGRLLRGQPPGLRTGLWALGGAALLTLPILACFTAPWGHGVVPIGEMWSGATSPGAPSLAGWLILAWVAGAIVVAGHFAIHLVRACGATRRAAPCTDLRVRAMLEELRQRVGLRRRVRVRVREGRAVPVTWGTLRPVILLPRAAEDWPEPRLRAVLLHELTHVRRQDFLLLLVQEAVRTVYWFNPLVWMVLERLRRDQELACDDAVVRDSMPAAAYARQLVAVARFALSGRGRDLEGALPVVRRRTLSDRVRYVMEQAGAVPNRKTLAGAVAVALLVLASAVPVARTAVLTCPSSPADAGAERAAPAITAVPLVRGHPGT